MYQLRLLSLIALTIVITGCANISKTPNEQRASIQAMRQEVLTDLFRDKPDTRSQINSAPGYAVFSNVNVNLIFASMGGGYGIAKNMRTGKETYMKMGEVGVGLGLGVKDFRAVMVFHTDKAYKDFIEFGWSFGGNADAAAKASDQGVAAGKEAVIDDVTIYQMTESGLALQATLKGVKFWKDGDLN
ncbi:MAG: YSC84-related protein [Gammaproteobacteria bacterium]